MQGQLKKFVFTTKLAQREEKCVLNKSMQCFEDSKNGDFESPEVETPN